MHQSIYKTYLSTYLFNLQTDIDFLKNIEMPVFDALEIDCSRIDIEHPGWIKYLLEKNIDTVCSVLYYITLSEGEECNTVLKKAAEAKKRTEISLPKINHSSKSNVLYVGKTNSNFPSRFIYHLGLKESKTYALYLKQWAAEYTFTLHFAKICFAQDNMKYLEQMETVLHDSLKPLLGRTGH